MVWVCITSNNLLPFCLLTTCNAISDWLCCVCVEQYPTEEDMIEWAKRESEREERERVARLTQQEQEDLELAIALSKSELSWPEPAQDHAAEEEEERTKS